MNKTQLVDVLAVRLGDRRTAAGAVDGLLETIVEAVRSGDTVSLTGFGVFTIRARAARLARNPRTGETVDVPATTVPAFRPGLAFRSAVSGVAAPAPARSAAASAGAGPTATAVAEPDGAVAAPGEAVAAPGEAVEKPARKPARPEKPEKVAKAGRSKPAKAKDDKPKKGKKK